MADRSDPFFGLSPPSVFEKAPLLAKEGLGEVPKADFDPL